jgi:hypothetical protein
MGLADGGDETDQEWVWATHQGPLFEAAVGFGVFVETAFPISNSAFLKCEFRGHGERSSRGKASSGDGLAETRGLSIQTDNPRDPNGFG